MDGASYYGRVKTYYNRGISIRTLSEMMKLKTLANGLLRFCWIKARIILGLDNQIFQAVTEE